MDLEVGKYYQHNRYPRLILFVESASSCGTGFWVSCPTANNKRNMIGPEMVKMIELGYHLISEEDVRLLPAEEEVDVAAGQYYRCDHYTTDKSYYMSSIFVIEKSVLDHFDDNKCRFQVRLLTGELKEKAAWMTKSTILLSCERLSDDEELTWILLSA